jgi:hypothetical protein
MKLRPHHLLCTQAFRGNGYDEAFVANMTAITSELRGNPAAEIEVVFGADDICAKCPNLINSGTCKSEERVRRFDRKVTEYFGIKEQRYIYGEIIREINSFMTKPIMNDICSECNWFTACALHKNR